MPYEPIRRSVARVRGRLLVLALVAAACGAPEELPIPAPANLDALAPAIREQYEEYRRAHEDRLAESDDAIERGEAHGALGRWYLAYQFHDGAETAFENSIILNPERAEWWYLHGLTEGSLGRLERAISSFGVVLEGDPEHLPALVRSAEALTRMGQFHQAASYAESAVSVDSGSVRARLAAATAASGTGDTAAAIDHLERAHQLAPDSLRVRYALGLALRDSGELDRARQLLDLDPTAADEEVLPLRDPWFRAVQRINIGAPTLIRRAKSAMRAGSSERALQLYEKALVSDPGSLAAAVGAASALSQLGRPDDELEVLLEADRRQPGRALVQSRLGDAFLGRGDRERAEGAYRASLESLEDHIPGLRGLCDLLIAEQRWEEAETVVHSGLRLHPLDPWFAKRELEILLRSGAGERFVALAGSARGRDLPAGLQELLIPWGVLGFAAAESKIWQEAFRDSRDRFRASASLGTAQLLVLGVASRGDFLGATRCQERLVREAPEAMRREVLARLAQLERGELPMAMVPSPAESEVFVGSGLPECLVLLEEGLGVDTR